MNLKEIGESLKLIKGIYGHRFFTDEFTAKAWETYLSPFPLQIVKKAIDEFIENNAKPGEPPTADVLMHLADKIWSQQESAVRKIEHKPIERDPKEFKKLSDESMELINLIQSGILSHDMILAKMSEINRKYPGIGWDVEMEKLKVFWAIQENTEPFRFKTNPQNEIRGA